MKVTQENEHTFRVELNDTELGDVIYESIYSEISTLDVMKANFLMTFVQIMSCRYLRRTLRSDRAENPTDNETPSHNAGDGRG